MATIQISKTKSAGTVTKTAVTQKQSLEVVQTMLHGSLSCISYLRELFAEKAYDDQHYETTDSLISYDDYVNGNVSASINRRESRTRMKVLRRGRSRRVDMFLDWLEKGAFPALQQGNLQSLQIYVHANASSRDEVLETYTFNVEYPSQVRKARTLRRGESCGSESALVDVHATCHALQELLRETMELCKYLPDLPPQRYISMNLHYTRQTSIADRPEGFIANDSTRGLIFPQADGWEVDAKTLSNVDSGFHSSSASISYLKPIGYIYGGFADLERAKLPEDLFFNRQNRADRRANHSSLIEIESTPNASQTIQHCDSNGDVVRQKAATERHDTVHSSEAETVVEHSSPEAAPFGSANGEVDTCKPVEEQSVGDGKASLQRSQLLLSQFSDVPNTQSSNVLGMRNAFANMMHPEQLTQGDTQTQVISPSPILRNNKERTAKDPAPPVKIAKPALSQHICKMLDSKKHELRQAARSVGKRTHQGSGGAAQVVLCQCGYEGEEGDMVECVYCETWQHLHCYGYLDTQDDQLPDDHVCYRCLLRDNASQQVLDHLKTVALQRRTVYVSRHQGVRTLKELATTMRIQPKEAKALQDFLKQQGYITQASDSIRRGPRTTLVAVSSGPDYNKMLNDLFDPLMYISHLYQLPGGQTPGKTGRTGLTQPAQELTMLPPVTPAAQLRKKKLTQTPASGLDLRNSATPFKTPTRFPAQRGLSNKRNLENTDDETIVATPNPKRTRTSPQRLVKSVRSEMMLNADGLSSSPAFPDLR